MNRLSLIKKHVIELYSPQSLQKTGTTVQRDKVLQLLQAPENLDILQESLKPLFKKSGCIHLHGLTGRSLG